MKILFIKKNPNDFKRLESCAFLIISIKYV